jgi:hypothetical protein
MKRLIMAHILDRSELVKFESEARKVSIFSRRKFSPKLFSTSAGMPDGIFSNQKFQFGLILQGLSMEWKVYFMAIWSILRPCSIFCGHFIYFMVIFFRFGMLCQDKSGNPARRPFWSTKRMSLI